MRDATDSLGLLGDVLAGAGTTAAVTDSGLTYIGLRWLGKVEGSPAVAELIGRFGLFPGLVVRTLVAVVLVAVVWRIVTVPHLRAIGLTAVAALNVWVVVWNIRIMWG